MASFRTRRPEVLLEQIQLPGGRLFDFGRARASGTAHYRHRQVEYLDSRSLGATLEQAHCSVLNTGNGSMSSG
jgi:hypothetical protein